MKYIQKIKKKASRSNFFRKFYNYLRERKLIYKFYKHSKQKDSSSFYRGVIFCVDGHVKHGGLADRFFGCLCVYALCKIEQCNFKLHYVSPFILQDYLVPNHYNWEIEDSEIILDPKVAYPLIKLGEREYYKKSPFYKENKQIHFYSNFKNLEQINKEYKTNFSFYELFHELFKPSLRFEQDLMRIKNLFPSKYISVCFRFQNFFGDFFEAKEVAGSVVDQEQIIQICHKNIHLIIREYNLPVLCTSDSQLFLNTLNGLANVYSIPGRVVHIDYTDSQDFEIYEKSFVDFYILGAGEKVIQFKGEHLMKSGFPRLAAYVQAKEYELKDLII